ncbi:MAG: leucine-rich repeat domain-containing protein [Mangrovimonas sp.]|nr:leucine-rich repeat domain-containing protein [Mangrovimonas sp.]
MKTKLLFLILFLSIESHILNAQTFDDGTFQFEAINSYEAYITGSLAGCPTGEITMPGYADDGTNYYTIIGIADNAFSNCTGLTKVTIGVPEGAYYIGNNAFSNCPNLTEISSPYAYEAITIGDSAFSGCSSLTTINFSEVIDELGAYAFSGCTSLSEIRFSDFLITIGDYAFNNCTGLASFWIEKAIPIAINSTVFNGVTISSIPLIVPYGSVATYQATSIWQDFSPIVQSTFNDGTVEYKLISLSEVKVLGGASGCPTGTVIIPETISDSGNTYTVTTIQREAFYNCSGISTLSLPNSLTFIDNYAFAYCSGITSVALGTGLENIGSSAFNGCSSLTSLTLPDSLTETDTGVFSDCTSLTSVTIGNGLNSINDFTFQNCTSLTSIIIPNSIESINTLAFYGCTDLASINFGSGVTTIENYAFASCTSLTAITIPDSVETIDSSAFRDCTSLSSIELGSGITTINSYAFRNCTNVSSVTANMITPTSITSSVFWAVDITTIPLTVPNGSLTAYQNATVWQNFNPINEQSTLSTNIESLETVSIYPNPATTTINISSSQQISLIELYDLTGKRVLLKREANLIDVSTLSPGLYLMTIQTNTGQVTKKIWVK